MLGGREAWLAVISTGRPKMATPMRELVGNATWYVRPTDSYPPFGRRPVSGGLCAARNQALRDAGELPCVQLSDDLTRTAVLHDGKAKPVSFDTIVEHVWEALADTPGARLAGGPPTSNPFFARDRIRTEAFIVGDFIVVEPGTVAFDERLRLKEDYDFTLQHLATYGRVCRCDWLLLTFRHRTNAGGAVTVRTPEAEQQAIGLLREKWGDRIRDNPRRPNEILLKFARTLDTEDGSC